VLSRVVRFFTESWALKLAAVAIAILLWLAVRAGDEDQATFRNIPVTVDLGDPDWRLRGDPEPGVVDVTVQGPTSQLMDLATGQPPRVVLEIERVNDTLESQVVPLQWVDLPRPGIPDTRAVDLEPDTIRLRYERLAARTLPVRIRTEGDLPAGFALSVPINTAPAAVEARGPARLLRELDSVPLLPVDLSGLRSTTNVPTQVDSGALGGITVEPREVNVILRVVPADSQPGPPADSNGQPPA
jgi:YbbR domain-containing protein